MRLIKYPHNTCIITSWNKGKHLSEEHRRKLSESRKGRFAGVNVPSYGRPLSEETRKKLSIACIGRRHTPEEIHKQIIAQTGKTYSEERRRKISIALTGKKLSLETRYKISQIQIGKHLREETKKKLSLLFKGRKISDETREKIRQARLRQILPIRDTQIEKMLQQKLMEKGIKFETHKSLPGQPDIFIAPNVCMFCDGDYWHANLKLYKEADFIISRNKVAQEVWHKDAEVSRSLESLGYRVLRFWETDIISNTDACIMGILGVI
jgi:DNA mismatch endonuclease Vsr